MFNINNKTNNEINENPFDLDFREFKNINESKIDAMGPEITSTTLPQ